VKLLTTDKYIVPNLYKPCYHWGYRFIKYN